MTEQSAQSERAPPERAPHVQPEHLTFAEAAERLHITANAVRMRVHRGSLASVRVNERTFVVWPQPAQEHAQRTHDARADEQAPVQSDDRLIARLESENAYLRQTLDAEIEARRRADHLVAALMERIQETREIGPGEIIDAEESTAETAKSAHAPVDAQEGPGRVAPPRVDDSTLRGVYSEPVPAQVQLAIGWRRWWRRIMGPEG